MTDFNHAGAFVVQFRTTTDFTRGHVEGRVEHVASGRAAYFTSTEELLESFARLAKAAPANPPHQTVEAGLQTRLDRSREFDGESKDSPLRLGEKRH